MPATRDQIKRILGQRGIDPKKLTESDLNRFSRKLQAGEVDDALKGLSKLRPVRETGHAGEIKISLGKIQEALKRGGIEQKQA